jgi:hypothetical protein
MAEITQTKLHTTQKEMVRSASRRETACHRRRWKMIQDSKYVEEDRNWIWLSKPCPMTGFLLSNKGVWSKKKKNPVTGRRIVRRRCSHIFYRHRFTDGGEVVSLTRQTPFTPKRIPDIHFWQTESTPGP